MLTVVAGFSVGLGEGVGLGVGVSLGLGVAVGLGVGVVSGVAVTEGDGDGLGEAFFRFDFGEVVALGEEVGDVSLRLGEAVGLGEVFLPFGEAVALGEGVGDAPLVFVFGDAVAEGVADFFTERFRCLRAGLGVGVA